MRVPFLACGSIVLFALSSALGGCTHVALEPQGSDVRRLGVQEAPACERIGTTRVKVLSKVLFVDRSKTTVAEELTILARNAAVLPPCLPLQTSQPLVFPKRLMTASVM